jgi:hypothetical protein
MKTTVKETILREVLRLELESLQMLRRRAKDDALRALVIAEREVAIQAEIEKLEREAA